MADNVLWIITDDQMRSTLPTMDATWKRLVEKGVRFRRGYTAMPWCGPARASMLTSRYPHDHGCHDNRTHRPFVDQGLDGDTVATRMRGADVDTGYFGKYMNGLGEDPAYVAPGWGRWVATVGKRGQVNVDGDVRQLDGQAVADTFAADRLRRFVERHEDSGPWFAVWAPSIPHDPYRPSEEHRHDFDDVTWDPPALTEADLSDKPSWMRDLPPQDLALMRRVLEGKLEELHLLGEHRLFRKEQPYEESAGIPYVVRGPGSRAGHPQRPRAPGRPDAHHARHRRARSRRGPRALRTLDARAPAQRRLVLVAPPVARREHQPRVGDAAGGVAGLHRAPRARRVGALRPVPGPAPAHQPQ